MPYLKEHVIGSHLEVVKKKKKKKKMGDRDVVRPLKALVTLGGSIMAGLFTLSLATSLSIEGVRAVIEAKKKRTAPRCGVCKGLGFVPCKLCLGTSTINWSPLYDPVIIKPCICPTCEGNKIQRCLNCVGKGYV